MRLIPFVVALSLAPACSTASIKLGDSSANGGDSSTNGGDSSTNGGDSGSHDSGQGGDTGANSDTGSAPDTFSGQVQGDLILADPHGGDGGGNTQEITCSGSATISVTSGGALAGTADCSTGHDSITGPMTGTVASGSVTANWDIALGPQNVSVPFTGTLHNGNLNLDANYDMGGGSSFTASIYATKN